MSIEKQLCSMLIPAEILVDFEVVKVEDTLELLIIELVEKETAIPKESLDKQLVFNGYLHPLELQHFPMNGKKCILRLVRRRWKEKRNSTTSYHNNYSFAVPGTKVTPSFGVFLKKLVTKNPFQLSVISDCVGIKTATFYRCYKEFLSEFRTEKEQNKLHEHDIPIKNTNRDRNEKSKISVPMLRPENMGTLMAIDEKHINNTFYTILTNGSTGKVALMIDSMNPKYIVDSLQKFGNKLTSVKTITRDLSPTYQSISTQFFPNAAHIADKFHVIAYAIEAVQDLRTKIRQENLSNDRKSHAEHAIKYKEYKKQLKENPSEKHTRVRKTWYPEKLKNGETRAELLARSRYLLFKKPQDWNDYQRERSVILFEEYPQLKTAYELICDFRNWYEPNGIKDSGWRYMTAETQLMHWMDLAETSKIEEVLNFRGLLERHFEPILNYHYEHKTNAMAESVNAKIKSALTNNKGARDLDFFYYRLNMIL